MHSVWLVPILSTVLTLAILGTQYLLFRSVIKRIDSADARVALAFGWTTHAKDEVVSLIQLISSTLLEHMEDSLTLHGEVTKEVRDASYHFQNRADELALNAERIKAHSQELLDRAEVKASSPRQAVTRN